MKNVQLFVVVMISMLAANAFVADVNAQSFAPVVTFSGADSQVSKPSFHRIRNLDDWARVWQQHTGQTGVKYRGFDGSYDTFYNKLSLPLIDFDRYMVIAIFAGSRWNSAGLNVAAVIDDPDYITVRFKNKLYGSSGHDGGGKQVNTFGFIVIPKSNKPVIVEEKIQAKNIKQFGNPLQPSPKNPGVSATQWKTRFRFEAVGK